MGCCREKGEIEKGKSASGEERGCEECVFEGRHQAQRQRKRQRQSSWQSRDGGSVGAHDHGGRHKFFALRRRLGRLWRERHEGRLGMVELRSFYQTLYLRNVSAKK